MVKRLSLSLIAANFIWVGALNAEPTDQASSASKSKIVRHEAPGNLEVTHKLGCVGIDEIEAEHTPADLYAAVTKCVLSDDYDTAAEAFAVAGAFGRFDKKRVTDESAHQAMTALLLDMFKEVSEDRKSQFQEAFGERFGGEEVDEDFCTQLRSLGPPTYRPTYMIQHGIEAFLPDPKKAPLVEDFDADEAWNQILRDSIGCPEE